MAASSASVSLAANPDSTLVYEWRMRRGAPAAAGALQEQLVPEAVHGLVVRVLQVRRRRRLDEHDGVTLALEQIPRPHGVTGAESLAFDRRGRGPYAGVSDGRVLRWDGNANGWTTFAYNANYKKNPLCTAPVRRPEDTESICGRPLGLQFYAKTSDLYIADAYLELMKVGPDGGEAEVVAAEAGGVPFNFTNGVDVDQATGDVYFTDSSTIYPRARNTQIMIHRDAAGRLLKYDARVGRVAVLKASLHYPNGVAIMIHRDAAGRLLKYDARVGRVAVLKASLHYPNGVAVSADRTHVVVAHTGPCQAFRYWIRGPKAGRYELLANLPGYADNVRRDTKGGYWFALNREKINATAPEHLVGHCSSTDFLFTPDSDAAVLQKRSAIALIIYIQNK
ncbi:protein STRICTOSIDINE SYNTHASE-LIKE 10-like [Setaria viridis]|uniref:protein STRICTOSIDINE SYNTHASE-LIKE 10-like n=1 Tax=Setaria viridis TaxID=4556 RepID=UPI003B3B29EF